MKDLVDTTEMYLRTIYELEEEGIPPLRARIVERLEQSGPTVSQTVARMERDGLLRVADSRELLLTEKGRERAVAVMRKHRLAERLLTDILGMDIERVHDEACRWEHVMSDEVEQHVVKVLDNVATSPFGNPIPGLDKLGIPAPAVDDAESSAVRLSDLPTQVVVSGTIDLINEIAQVEQPIFQRLHALDLQPGSHVTVLTDGSSASITNENGETITVPAEISHAIRVTVDA